MRGLPDAAGDRASEAAPVDSGGVGDLDSWTRDEGAPFAEDGDDARGEMDATPDEAAPGDPGREVTWEDPGPEEMWGDPGLETVAEGETLTDGSAEAGACKRDEDCADALGPLGPCEVALCLDGICTSGLAPTGTACDDADPCTTHDYCQGGVCQSGTAATPPDCERSNKFGTCHGEALWCDPISGWQGCNAKTPSAETCNGLDDNCDGVTDPENLTGCTTYYFDEDGDGYGLTWTAKCLCFPSGNKVYH